MQSRDKEQASSRGVNEILQVEAIVRYKWVAISVTRGGTREGYSGPTEALEIEWLIECSVHSLQRRQ